MHNKVHYNKVCQNHSSNLGVIRFLSSDTFENAWNKAESNYMYFVEIIGNNNVPINSANRWFCQQWKNDSETYGWQVAWSFQGNIFKREKIGSTSFTTWREIS